MKNIFAVSLKKFKQEELEAVLMAQIENSIRLGWELKDIVVISSISLPRVPCSCIFYPFPDFARTNQKTFAADFYFREINSTDSLWLHDLDAWQTTSFKDPLECQAMNDIGVVLYRNSRRVHGASVFCKPSSADLYRQIVQKMLKESLKKEEPTLTSFYENNPNRFSILDCRFNYNKQHRKEKVLHYESLPYVSHKPTRSFFDCLEFSTLQTLVKRHSAERFF